MGIGTGMKKESDRDRDEDRDTDIDGERKGTGTGTGTAPGTGMLPGLLDRGVHEAAALRGRGLPSHYTMLHTLRHTL